MLTLKEFNQLKVALSAMLGYHIDSYYVPVTNVISLLKTYTEDNAKGEIDVEIKEKGDRDA